jgi:disulfide bond formation protein DsbB
VTSLDLQQMFDHPRVVPSLVMAVCLGSLGTALASQYWGGLQPCILCIYQRWAYVGAFAFGLAALGLGNWPRARQALVALAGLTFLAGAAIAAFHVGVEQHWWRGTTECHAPALDPDLSIEELRKRMLESRFVPCDVIPWSLFGISMAGYNAIFSLGLGLATLYAAWRISGRTEA